MDKKPMRGDILRAKEARAIHGVNGRALNVIADGAGGIASQIWKASREYLEHGRRRRLTVELRFDDSCRNGHASFAITADQDEWTGTRWRESAGGCLHGEIAARFPELASLAAWHLTGTDGPMHYVANALWHAGNRDHWGLRAGEVRQIRNGKTGQLAWRLAYVDASGAEVPRPADYVDGDTAPVVPTSLAYLPWTQTGEGKARDLDATRRVAVWPEASDAELCAGPDTLRAALVARLPALLERFKAAMLECGFIYPEA